MRLRWVAFVMMLGLCPSVVRAVPWELALHGGAGALVGSGWDANQVGPSLLVSGGPRLRYVALHGAGFAHQLVLRAVQREDQVGQSFGALVTLPVYPLGARYAFEPYIAPAVGVGVTVARVDVGADVELATRQVHTGILLGGYWAFHPRYALGASLFATRLWVRYACIRVAGGVTACDVSSSDTFVLSALASFRVTLGK